MIYLESVSTDPAFNLALEEHVFERVARKESCVMLWQNDHAVIVGKHQNTAREVNDAVVRERGIQVVRRLSGGGAVYHDLGNLNFTLIAGAAEAEKLDFTRFVAPMVSALQSFGVNAVATGRNDITVEGAKFSGNAQYLKHGRVMHHGTVMYDSDLSVLSAVLSPREDKFQDKAVNSVRSRVTNLKPYLKDVTLEELKAAFIRELGREEAVERREFTEADLAAAAALKRERYGTWDWNYGRSPAYQVEKRRRIDGVGTVELQLSTDQGRLCGFKSYGDFFGDGDDAELQARLLGCPLEAGALQAALSGLSLERHYRGLEVEAFIRLLVE